MSKKSELYFYSGKTYIIPYGAPFRQMLYSQSLGQLHYHDFYELVIVLDGNAVHRTEEQDYPISAGDVFIIKKGKIHMYTATRKLKLANIMFDFETLDINWEKLHDIPGYTALFETEPKLRDRNHFKSKHTLNTAQLNEVSILLQRMHRETEEKSPGWIMMSHNAVGTRIFKELLGKSPFEYLIQTRIHHAAELLKNTDKSVSDIAYECGFHDSNYFSLQFKKATGLPPRDFAKRHRTFQ